MLKCNRFVFLVFRSFFWNWSFDCIFFANRRSSKNTIQDKNKQKNHQKKLGKGSLPLKVQKKKWASRVVRSTSRGGGVSFFLVVIKEIDICCHLLSETDSFLEDSQTKQTPSPARPHLPLLFWFQEGCLFSVASWNGFDFSITTFHQNPQKEGMSLCVKFATFFFVLFLSTKKTNKTQNQQNSKPFFLAISPFLQTSQLKIIVQSALSRFSQWMTERTKTSLQ